jgi:iron complex transport system ATP-binding protein
MVFYVRSAVRRLEWHTLVVTEPLYALMSFPPPPLLSLKHVTVFRGNTDGTAAQNARAAEQTSELTSEVAPVVARPALDDISLRIEAGEHVCILGPNGCGKSTLIKTITRECYPVVRGGSSISILGRERWNIFELRSLLGIVSPDLLGACTTDATGRDVVLSGFFSSTRIFPHQHPDPAQLALADRALERMGVAHLAGRAVAHMSSGEAKRTLIARALVHDPRALLFDEPSNALDIAAQLQLRAAMRELAQSGIAILLVTHHVSEIIPEIERVILLRDGGIIADGPKAEVLTAEGISGLFGIPLRISQQDGYFHIRE